MSEKALDKHKEALELDNTEIAALCGVTPATVRNWDGGRTNISQEGKRLLGMLAKMKDQPDMKCGDIVSMALGRAKEDAKELRKKR